MEMFRKGSEARFLFEIQGAPEMEVTGFRAIEELSKPFAVFVSFACKTEISSDDVIHKEALLTIKGAETDRYFHGIVGMFRILGKTGRKYLYDAEIVPSFQLLSLKQDCRIFQKTQVQDIITTIFKENGILPDRFVFRLKNKEHGRKFCVQYKETNLDFVSRLLEEEGIYYVVAVDHSGSQPRTLEEDSGSDSGTTYGNRFLVIPSSVPYRPLREHEKPIVKGMHSAIVVGPPGEEIYTDGYGRVKVQFYWDRSGKRDERSSCWLRFLQAWGGESRGTMFIPRVGDEALVGFVDGDPDRPIIVRSFYNGDNMPLYNLPEHKTRSTIKTRSYPDSKGFNELRFEDRAGNEEIFLHGEKDWNIAIRNDKGQSVGHDETLIHEKDFLY